jgi:4-diphosphocytidyl-2-C-methyl-D-erythritol kinase
MYLKIRSPAKVNLFLEVIGKRKDNYHEIETVMQSITLYDILYFRSTAQLGLRCDSAEEVSVITDNLALENQEDNLVYRAIMLMKKEYGIKKGVSVELYKKIPIGAGLGGGSSNAASTLIALNQLWRLGLSKSELVLLGSRLGSDVPFFIYGKTGLVKGRGEIVFPLPVNPNFYYTIIYPPISVTTGNIYKNLKFPLTKTNKNVNIMVNKLLKQRVNYKEIKKLLYNRLESVALRQYPVLKTTHQAIHKIATDGLLLSGSGSSFFKLSNSLKEANYFADLFSEQKLVKVFVAKTVKQRISQRLCESREGRKGGW